MRQADQITKYQRTLLLLLVLVLIAFALRTFRVDQQSFTWDEAKSVERALMPVRQMIRGLVTKGNQLPLYYLLLIPWSHVGTGEFVVRFFSVLLGSVSIPLIYQVGRIAAGRLVGLLAAALLTLSPFHIWYSQEARMYAFLVLTMILAHWFLLRLLRGGRPLNWAGYALSMAAAVYSHYFALLVFLAHYIFFAFHLRQMRAKFLQWTATTAVVALSFIPWGLLIFSTSQSRLAVPPWITPVDWVDPLLTLFSFGAGPTADTVSIAPYVVFTVYVLGLLLTLGLVKQDGAGAEETWPAARLFLLWFLVPLGMTFLLSLDWPGLPRPPFSLYVDRYLIVILPALALLTAWGLYTLARRRTWLWLPPLALLLVGVGTLPSLANLYFDPLYARTDWRGAIRHVQEQSAEGDVLLVRGDTLLPLRHYGEPLPAQIQVPQGPGAPAQQDAFQAVMSARLQEAAAEGAQRAWLLSPVYLTDTHGFMEERNKVITGHQAVNAHQEWMDGQYERLDSWAFSGIRVSLYALSPKEQSTR